MTPEGKVKAAVDKLLKSMGCYYLKPVQNGMGSPALDYHGSYKGLSIVIETKAPGEKPTPRQLLTLRAVIASGSAAFVIDGDLTELTNWLHLPVPGYTNSLLKKFLNKSDPTSTTTPDSD